ncbi:ATP synthase I chain [Paucidesulfovibrio gracilis DSM 16080]|uniref:ATP synthase I chain n=1 Tax=Paucidesulfovibrio gracilis DSM 16080 TaxID=1121449 RepID=A0A1T4Y5R7_9BACT|nr:ATP synthase subunit I [Paucidesulfovibrio gracilis]SKA97119.1 ATP synthase I chain [Paucidesulfovibrio gracilis DSM 16080]
MFRKLEAMLYKRGFTHPQVRAMVRNQLVLATLSILTVNGLTLFSVWGWSFAAGCLLMTVNFWWMAKAGQKLVSAQKGAVTALLILFYGRMALTGLALFALIAWLDASVSGLLVGLSTVVVNAITWGTANYMQKAKEA